MKGKTPLPAYIEQAKSLTKEEAERVFSRMRRKLSRKVEHGEIDPLEAVALQLRFEDDQLKQWRENMADLRKNHTGPAEAGNA